MSVPSAPAFRSHPFLEQPLNIISLQIRKFVREPSTGSCVRIPPAAVCCVFFFFSECFHCSRPFEVTFCHFFTSSLGCCSSPKPFCFMHPYDQLRLAPGPVFFILWPDLTAALEACGAMDSDAIKMSSGRPAGKRSAGRK